MRTKLLWLCAALTLLAGLGAGAYAYLNREPSPAPMFPMEASPDTGGIVIGRSVEGRAIDSYTFGDGDAHVLFVGGMHGGYEWNSILLAYEAIDYFTAHADAIPEGVTVTIIPNANPDGVFKILGKEGRFTHTDVPGGDVTEGRFNANGVDLNRNFECKWQPESSWRGQTVSAGASPFSEPEAQALRGFVTEHTPDAVVFWHSQANAVYASECEDGILAGTRTLMETYAGAADYPTVDTFDAYPITGDAEGWLASIGIPAITVELSTRETTEWERNLAGVQAVLTEYSASR